MTIWNTTTTPTANNSTLDAAKMIAVDSSGEAIFVPAAPIIARAVADAIAALGLPAAPPNGLYNLRSTNGVMQWVTADPGGAPVNTTAPSISGTGVVGATMTRTAGIWSGSPTLAGQWFRNYIEAISGATAATHVVLTADKGPTRLSYLPYDLYDGGLCPGPNPGQPAQSGNYYVDPLNGNDANNGTSAATPWKMVQGRTISNAVVWVMGSGVVDLTAYMQTQSIRESWFTDNTLSNVTIRPVGENVITIANRKAITVSPANGATLIYFSGDSGAASNVTVYKIGSEGWGNGFYCEHGVSSIRFLRCLSKNPHSGSHPSPHQSHGWYVGYTGASGRPNDFEFAYCEMINNTALRAGSCFHFFSQQGAGLEAVAVHHNIMKAGSNMSWWLAQDKETTLNADVFCNTIESNFTGSPVEFSDYGDANHGSACTSAYKLYANIFVNTGTNRRISWIQSTHAPNLGANNTVWATAGVVTYANDGGSGATVGSTATWGAARNPGLDANGIASNVLEQGSGPLRTATPGWLGYEGKMPSSLTNVDRGAYAYGVLGGQPGRLVYKETGTNAVGSATALSNSILAS